MFDSPTQALTLLSLAEHAALEAGSILRRHFRAVNIREKSPGDLVTDADLESQRRIADILATGHPGSTLLAEEEGVRPDPEIDWCWVVDPLDGTTNFAHGLFPWCVSIGLVHRGQPVLGVIYEPAMEVLYSAARGRGARENGVPMKVSSADQLSQSLIATGFPTRPDDMDRQLVWFGRFSQGTHSVRRSGSTAWNLAMVARGSYEIMYASGVHPWDVAAGVVLVEESGGQVSSLEGTEYRLEDPPILATNRHVHQQALDVLNL